MDPHRHQHQLGRMGSSPILYDQTHSRVTINIFNLQRKNGDPYGIRTHVIGVRGRCLNHLTNGPFPYFNSSGQRPEPSLTSGPTSLMHHLSIVHLFLLVHHQGLYPRPKNVPPAHFLNGLFSSCGISSFRDSKRLCSILHLVHHQGLEPGTP